jgi:hypothetical protein
MGAETVNRKKACLILGMVVVVVIIAICSFVLNNKIGLPDSQNVASIEMERIHTPGVTERYSDGIAVTEHIYDIDSILSALSGAKKTSFTWRGASNDVPPATSYLAIRIQAEREGGFL